MDNLHYEVHSDIEKLLEETSRSVEEEDEVGERRRKKRGKGRKKKVKMIRFSKTPSPQTEQVIRVDVTSNVSANADRRRTVEIAKLEEEECAKRDEIDVERKNLEENAVEMCDEEFIVRCRQLALRQRRSKRLR